MMQHFSGKYRDTKVSILTLSLLFYSNSHTDDKPKSKNKKRVTFLVFPQKTLFQTTGPPSEVSQGLNPKETDSSKDHTGNPEKAPLQSKRNATSEVSLDPNEIDPSEDLSDDLQEAPLQFESSGTPEMTVLAEVSLDPNDIDPSKDLPDDLQEAPLQFESSGTPEMTVLAEVSLDPNDIDPSKDLPDDLQEAPPQFESSGTPEMTIIAAEISTESSIQVDTIQIVNDMVQEEEAGKDKICRETGELEVISEATRNKISREDEDPLVEYVNSLAVQEKQKEGEHQPDVLHLDDEGAVGKTGQGKGPNGSVSHLEEGTVKQVLEDNSRSSSSSLSMLTSAENNRGNQNDKLVEGKNDTVADNSGSIDNKISSRNGVVPVDTLQDCGNQITGYNGGALSFEGKGYLSGGECQIVAPVPVESSSDATTSGMLSSKIDDESRIVAQILAELGIMIAQEVSPRSKNKDISQLLQEEPKPSAAAGGDISLEANQVSDLNNNDSQTSGEEELQSEIPTSSEEQTVVLNEPKDQVTSKDQEMSSNYHTAAENKLQDGIPTSAEEQPGTLNDPKDYAPSKDQEHAPCKVPSEKDLRSNTSVTTDDHPHERTVSVAEFQPLPDSHEDHIGLVPNRRRRRRGRPKKCKKSSNLAHPVDSIQVILDPQPEKSDLPSTQTENEMNTRCSSKSAEVGTTTEQPQKRSSRLHSGTDGGILQESPSKQKQSKQLKRRSSRNLRRSPRLVQLQYRANIYRSPPKISPKQSPKKKIARLAKSPELPQTPPTSNQETGKFAEPRFKVYDFGDDIPEEEPATLLLPKRRCFSPTKVSCIVPRCQDSSQESDGQDNNNLHETSPLTPSPTWIDSTAMRLIAKGALNNKNDQKKANRQKNVARKIPNHKTPTKRKRKSGFPTPIKFVKKRKQDMFRKKAAQAVESARKKSTKKKAMKRLPSSLNSKKDAEDLQPDDEEELMQAILGMGLDFDDEHSDLIPDCFKDKTILEEQLDEIDEDNHSLPVSIINDSCDNWMYYDHDNPELDSSGDDDDYRTLRRRRSGDISGPFCASQNLCEKFTEFCANLSQESSSQLTDVDCDEMAGLEPTLNAVTLSPLYSLDDSASEVR